MALNLPQGTKLAALQATIDAAVVATVVVQDDPLRTYKLGAAIQSALAGSIPTNYDLHITMQGANAMQVLLKRKRQLKLFADVEE